MSDLKPSRNNRLPRLSIVRVAAAIQTAPQYPERGRDPRGSTALAAPVLQLSLLGSPKKTSILTHSKHTVRPPNVHALGAFLKCPFLAPEMLLPSLPSLTKRNRILW